MNSLIKRSWQIPFLLFLIIGTYYTLSLQNKQPNSKSTADTVKRVIDTDTLTTQSDTTIKKTEWSDSCN